MVLSRFLMQQGPPWQGVPRRSLHWKSRGEKSEEGKVKREENKKKKPTSPKQDLHIKEHLLEGLIDLIISVAAAYIISKLL